MSLKPNEILLIKGGLGRFHRVTAIFIGLDAVNQANAYLAAAPGEAVIAVFDDIIFLASTSDLGLSAPVHSSQES
jgi:hypothetical protein